MSVLDRFRLDGETVIVTGGNRGIGKGIATGMAEVGANVVIANRTAESGQAAAEEIADETGAETAAIPTDVTDEAEVQAMVEETVDRFGSVDVLVNNAGIAIHEPAEEKPLENWKKTLDINTTGAFICAKHAGREMIDGDGGSIVNISSMSAFVANYPQCQVDYQASKGGLEGLKLQLASEWAEHGIRVNNINPGYIETDILTDDEELIETWKSEMLLDEFGTPEDIAPLAVYLASDAAAYVTGSSFLIDGGYMVR
ncbi:SDR family NAD(P)-dependent oxidoreductase [Halomicroarcula sp. GCM10025817]|uniref:SDR family NAD(P)-dependent oxidoreductase n=1 Tax=Halomicroarcula sp. GCM10025817 TaxID=3252672 RepID=UPI00361A9C30